MLKKEPTPENGTARHKPVPVWKIAASAIIVILVLLGTNESVQREISAYMTRDTQPALTVDSKTVNALATDDAVALFAYQPGIANTVHQRLMTELGLEGFLPPRQDPANGWMHNLVGLLTDESHQISSILAGLYPKGTKYDYVTVVQGQFTSQQIQESLKQYFGEGVVVKPDGSIAVYSTASPCEQKKLFSILLKDKLIILGDADRIQMADKRLQAGMASTHDNLGDWMHFASQQLLSSVLLMPSDQQFSIPDEAVKSIVNRIYTHARRHGAVFLGASLAPLPARIKMTVQIHNGNVSSEAKIPRLSDDMLTNTVAKLQDRYQAIKSLADATTVKDQQGRLVLHTLINADTLYALQTIPLDYISETTGLPRLIREIPPYAGEERTQGERQITAEVFNLESLQYNPDSSMPVDSSSGPFGLVTDAVRQHNNGKQLTLTAITGSIPNGEVGAKAVLRLHTDRSRTEDVSDCDQSARSHPIRVSPDGATSQISILLPELPDTLHGEIQLSVPQQIRTVEIPLRAGENAVSNGVLVEIVRTNGSETHYRATGELDRLLSMAVLNDQGEVIQERYRHSLPYQYGYGERGYLAVMGKGKTLAIKTTVSVAEASYPFTLRTTPVAPYHQTQTAAVKYYDYDVESFTKKYRQAPAAPISKNNSIGNTTAGGFTISVADLDGIQSLSLFADIYSIPAYNLEQNYAALQLQVDSLVRADGTRIEPPEERVWRKPVVMEPFAGLYHDKVHIPLKINTPARDITQLTGRLTLTMSKDYEIHSWERPMVGDTLTVEDIQLTLIEQGRNSITLSAEGNTDSIVTVQLLDEQSNQVITTGVDINIASGWEAVIHKQGNYSTLLVLLSDQQSRADIPFKINLH